MNSFLWHRNYGLGGVTSCHISALKSGGRMNVVTPVTERVAKIRQELRDRSIGEVEDVILIYRELYYRNIIYPAMGFNQRSRNLAISSTGRMLEVHSYFQSYNKRYFSRNSAWDTTTTPNGLYRIPFTRLVLPAVSGSYR